MIHDGSSRTAGLNRLPALGDAPGYHRAEGRIGLSHHTQGQSQVQKLRQIPRPQAQGDAAAGIESPPLRQQPQ